MYPTHSETQAQRPLVLPEVFTDLVYEGDQVHHARQEIPDIREQRVASRIGDARKETVNNQES